MIDAITLRLLHLPLKVPYKLAFGPITHFDTILAQVSVDGSIGLGEATILTGYTNETVDESWKRMLEMARRLPGISSEAAKTAITSGLNDAPFAATAMMTAIEMAENHPTLQIEQTAHVPLLAGINATDRDGIVDEIEKGIAAGFGTFKIKVGFDIESDLQRVQFIQDCTAGRAQLRIDANQGYSRDDGCNFASSINPVDIELLEQPCHADDWESLAAVAAVTEVPLMLDESIYNEADIQRAALIGASFVKLKLMKLVSLDRLEQGLALICDLGMEPVLGNGVASDIGCWMEACVAHRHIRNAGEMNGFLRQREQLARPPLEVKGSMLCLAPGASPKLCEETLRRVTVATACFDKTSKTAGVTI
jgi:L-alanine-DL-glutamate epimerase-like enolase superfamily enzyme